MKLLILGQKILQEASSTKWKVPFKFFYESKHFKERNEEKTDIFLFTGPFWAFLGTPNNTHHHDSFFFSLLHQEVFLPKILECWDFI